MYSTSNLIQQDKTIVCPSISASNSMNDEEPREKHPYFCGS